MTISGIQPNSFLQQLPATVRQTLDTNSDGSVQTGEVVDFLEQLLAAVKADSGASYATSSGLVNKSTPVPLTGTEAKTPATSTDVAATWRDRVFGLSTSGNYAGVMAVPNKEIASGYTAGAYRHQLEGFNSVKFDPTHPEGMTLKMIAGRVFEQFDVYSDTAIDGVVSALNAAGISASKVGLDKIDFGNGEGPVDVIRNAAWLDGDKSTGMAWQWGPELDVEPMNFTMQGIAAPISQLAGGAGATGGVSPTTPTGATTGVESPNLYPGSVDQLDLAAVNWLHTDVSSWPVTSKVTDVEIGSSTIAIEHTKAGDWPEMDYSGIKVEGNPWVFVNRNGQWYGATYDWLRPGQTEKQVSASDIGENIKLEPLASWQPQPGELVGFMVSTPARDSSRTSNERTNVVLTHWPA